MSVITTRSLGDVCRIIAGQHIEASRYSSTPDGVPYLTGPADFGDRFPIVSKWTRAPKVFAAETDVLLTVKGAGVGKSNLGCNAAIGRQLMALRPDPSKVTQAFLFHFVRSRERRISLLGQGATVPGIGKEELARFELPVPLLPEQRRIAEVLDRAEALRAKRRAALAQLDTLTQALFVHSFGDPLSNTKRFEVVTLGSLCRRITDGTHQPPTWSPMGHPFLFVSNIVSGEIIFETEKFISDETHAELTRRCPIEVGDVLYSTVGSYGIPALVRTTRKFAFQRHIAHLKPDPQFLDPEFLSTMLASPPLRRQADRAARGIAQKTVNLADIREFVVFKPPLKAQQEFGDRIATVGRLKAAQRASLTHLDALFASLQHRAFRGEL